MKTSITVEDRKEADLIRRGLNDPTVRALVKVCGVLATLPSDRARGRVLWHVADYLDEQHNSSEPERMRSHELSSLA